MLPQTARAKDALFFILDCSGSMWGRVDGQPKISAAKDVLVSLLKEVPPEFDVGLMVYGHRRKGDCKDIETIHPLGPASSELLDRVRQLTARGKTPISDALLRAGELLSGREDATTLVLISDGLETCGGDPCAVAARLKEQGLKVVIHVVGFDVTQEEGAKLSCIAEAGGGYFFLADNVDKLRQILMEVKSAVVEKQPVSEPPPPPKISVPSGGKAKVKVLRIKGPGTIVLDPAPWVKVPPYEWAVVDVESGKVQTSVRRATQLRTSEGEYQILWRQTEHHHTPVVLTEVVKVKSGKTVKVPITTGIRVAFPEEVGPPYQWGLMRPSEKEPFWTTDEVDAGQVVPAGTYRLYWHQDEHRSDPLLLKTVEVQEGQLNDVVLDTGIALRTPEWMGEEIYYWALKDSDGNQAARWEALKPQLAPPGTYTLVVRLTEHRHSEVPWGSVTIQEGEFTEVTVDSGISFTHPDGARPPYRIFVVNKETGFEIVASDTWGPILVPPGRYRLDWWEREHQTTRQTLVEEFEVEPGTLLQIEM